MLKVSEVKMNEYKHQIEFLSSKYNELNLNNARLMEKVSFLEGVNEKMVQALTNMIAKTEKMQEYVESLNSNLNRLNNQIKILTEQHEHFPTIIS